MKDVLYNNNFFLRLSKFFFSPVFIIIYLSLIVISYVYLDIPIALFFKSLDLSNNSPIFLWITQLGLGGIYIGSLLLIALCFRYIYKHKEHEYRAWFLWLCVAIPSSICVVLKVILSRARPELFFENQSFGFYWFKFDSAYWSYPSGHTTTIMGLAFSLAILYPRRGVLVLLLASIIALSRVLLTNHYLSDVLSAFYLTFIEISLLYWFINFLAKYNYSNK